MKITVNIETSDPNDVVRIGQALGGASMTVSLTDTAAPKATREKREPVASPPASAPASAPAAAPTVAGTPTPSPMSAPASAAPSEADIIAAVNGAVATLGVSGVEKIKNYIKANFQKPDGSPAGLKSVRDDQKPKLMADLQGIAAGTITL